MSGYVPMRINRLSKAIAMLALAAVSALAQTVAVITRHVGTIPNANNPELVYYFVDPGELKDGKYLKTVDDIIARGPFDFIFLTQRNGADFYDYATMRPIFIRLVAEAHAKGVKVGLQLWSKGSEIPEDKDQAILVDQELPSTTTATHYTPPSRGASASAASVRAAAPQRRGRKGRCESEGIGFLQPAGGRAIKKRHCTHTARFTIGICRRRSKTRADGRTPRRPRHSPTTPAIRPASSRTGSTTS